MIQRGGVLFNEQNSGGMAPVRATNSCVENSAVSDGDGNSSTYHKYIHEKEGDSKQGWGKTIIHEDSEDFNCE